jgi:Amt family ammonium transporter
VSALVLAVMLGRESIRRASYHPHNVPFVLLGAALLWFGWFGFNGGSALAADGLAIHAL